MAFDNSDLLVDDLLGVVIYGVQKRAGAINVKIQILYMQLSYYIQNFN